MVDHPDAVQTQRLEGDDIKIKRKVSPFFLSPLVYLPFIAVLSLFFTLFHGLEVALKCL